MLWHAGLGPSQRTLWFWAELVDVYLYQATYYETNITKDGACSPWCHNCASPQKCSEITDFIRAALCDSSKIYLEHHVKNVCKIASPARGLLLIALAAPLLISDNWTMHSQMFAINELSLIKLNRGQEVPSKLLSLPLLLFALNETLVLP